MYLVVDELLTNSSEYKKVIEITHTKVKWLQNI